MKISKQNKELFEANLFEADDSAAIDMTAGVSAVADEITDDIEKATGGAVTLTPGSAAKAAGEATEVASDLGISVAAVDPPEDDFLGVENPITEVLDMALRGSQRDKRDGIKSGYNVLIIGMPGSGKTATVEDWAKARGVNLVPINAKNNDLDAYINGYTTKDPENPHRVMQAFSSNLAGLDRPNSVLFLDEYNRQVKPQIRASLYTLINEHRIVGDDVDKDGNSTGTHYFKNMLFTIAAINPAVPTDKGAVELNDAEKSRFWWTMDDMDSDPVTTIEYLTKYYNKEINKLDPESETYRERLERFLRILDLGSFIVSHPKFSYDTRDDLEDLAYTQANLLCQRSLTQGLNNSEGDAKMFKFWVEKGAKFLEKNTEMFRDILREYVVPSFEELCASHDITVKAAATKDETKKTMADEFEDSEELGLEDDDDFFVSGGFAGKIRAKNPADAEIAITKAISGW